VDTLSLHDALPILSRSWLERAYGSSQIGFSPLRLD